MVELPVSIYIQERTSANANLACKEAALYLGSLGPATACALRVRDTLDESYWDRSDVVPCSLLDSVLYDGACVHSA